MLTQGSNNSLWAKCGPWPAFLYRWRAKKGFYIFKVLSNAKNKQANKQNENTQHSLAKPEVFIA